MHRLYLALQSTCAMTTAAIQSDIVTVANKAYSKRLISENVHSRILTTAIPDVNKASELMSAVLRRVKLHPKSYQKFMEILREEPAYSHLVKTIERSVKKRWKGSQSRSTRGVRGCIHKLASQRTFKWSRFAHLKTPRIQCTNVYFIQKCYHLSQSGT